MKEISNNILKECYSATARIADNEIGEAILHITVAAIICIKFSEEMQNFIELKGKYEEQSISNPNKNTAVATLLLYQAGYYAESKDYLECLKCIAESALHLGLDLEDLDPSQFEYSSTEELHSQTKQYVIKHTEKIIGLLKNDKLRTAK
ncbi:hypothetical protein QTV49_000329 [Vibrio vulnificus]|nr:hypothetical protein [Vibrio vulnificus]